MSLRLRVALAAALAAAVVVVVAGFGVLVLARHEQQARLDEQLREQALQTTRPAVLTAALRDRRFLPPPRRDLLTLVRVLDGEEVLFESTSFPAVPTDTAAGISTQRAEGEHWRVLMTEVPLGRNQEVTVQLTASLAGVDEAVRDLRRLLLLVGAAAIGGAAAGGWLLGSVAIRPLQRLRGEAERVAETADLSRRVPTAQGPREVDELAASLNTMLDRLEGSAAETEAALTASRQFAANVAHELRTPLTSIRTNLEVLASHPTLPVAERATILGEVQAQHARLLEALDALRLLARGELAADDLFVATDVAELLDEVVAQAAGRHPEATITLEARADPLEVRAWPEGLRVLVDNLVRNAVTHGRPSDGTADGTPPEVRVELDADEREWWIAVSDRGPGVPPAERARIFERFTRGSEAAAQGSGLGLALVAQQVELLGGQVTIEDAPGGGARFVARMPRR